MTDDKKDIQAGQSPKKEAEQSEKLEDKDIKAPVSAICDNAQANAAALADEDDEIKPVEGFFLTSQRWH
ncbi:MAG: hypothetical protein LBU07_03495 [Coriobacteriales bacterium]|jgi:hypothetical protein|nr:hypothetical protein [Coriobacteriales bacterium]